MDLLLDNALIVDGTGAPAYPGSILLREGRIAATGLGVRDEAAQTVDCAGFVVSPGFIDVHTHSDYEVLDGRTNKVSQGVTTEVVGNCGYSLFPAALERLHADTGDIFENLPELGIDSAADYFAAAEHAKPLVNVAALTGHSAIRRRVLGMSRNAPTRDEQREMERLLEQSLDEGSIGFSTGLNCLPSSFAQFDELAALCRVLKRYGAFYTTHMRDYKFRAVEAVEEAIRLAETAEVAVQLSHVQVVGKKNWHQLDVILELVDKAARRGLDVGMDAYPYLAGSCSFLQFLPEWSQDGGVQAVLRRLESPADRDRIARETDDYMANTWADIVICGVNDARGAALVGRTVQDIADERGRRAPDTAIELLREQQGNLYVISFNSREENVRKVISHPLTSVCSDSFVATGLSHPRTFGTYPQLLGYCVRERHWMPLEVAVAKATSVPAKRFRMRDRGVIARGARADVVVFDPAAIGPGNDYTRPSEPPVGIRMVIVNGEIVIENGRASGNRSGAPVRLFNQMAQ
ncbi:MAG: D-aminoacylase [Acidobacteria bacterium]|nr:D-aminoacylase [Acidobacteriota bacterium]